MARHPAGDRVDREPDVHAFLLEGVGKLADLVLRLGHGHAVAGHDHDAAGHLHDLGRLVGRGRAHVAVLAAGLGHALIELPERPEEHVAERAVHRAAHDDRQDQAGGAVERAGDDQQLVVEHEAQRRGRQAGVGVEQGDDRRHVGAADRHDQQHAEDQPSTTRIGTIQVDVGENVKTMMSRIATPSTVKFK